MIYHIPVITRLQDNGDGGYTMYVYNNEDELIADHPNSYEFKKVGDDYQDVLIELTKEQRDYILTEQDPYENGYIGKNSIEIVRINNGLFKLSKPLSFHCGQ